MKGAESLLDIVEPGKPFPMILTSEEVVQAVDQVIKSIPVPKDNVASTEIWEIGQGF